MRWNENFGTTGAWDPTGCTLIETNAVETKCECVHFGAQVWQMILYYPNPKCIFILPYSALTHCWNWQNGHDNHNLSADIDLMGYQFRDRKKLTRGQWPFRSAGKRAMMSIANDVNLLWVFCKLSSCRRAQPPALFCRWLSTFIPTTFCYLGLIEHNFNNVATLDNR